MGTAITIPLVAAVCVLGCSRNGSSIAGKKCSGDLGSFVAQCVTNRGGVISTNLSAIQAQWTYRFTTNGDLVFISGDHFSEVQSFLRQAYGEAVASAGSCATHPKRHGQSAWYAPRQIGVTLNLAGDTKQTVIIIRGQVGLVTSPPESPGGANGWKQVN